MTRLHFITENPPNAGTPLHMLDGSNLDANAVYLRNNFTPPETPPSRVDVQIGDRITTLDSAGLAHLQQVEVEMVLECAGNGRIYMDPVPDGTPWDLGGASPVMFAGAGLLDALGRIPDDVVELVCTGADSGEVDPEGHISYQFSLTRDLWDRSILATHLSGRPLTIEHGGPVRLVVPGHYAMKSVKWLTKIVGFATPFTAHFVNKYRYFGDSIEDEAAPVGPIRVRSLIASPSENDHVAAGIFEFAGSAWSGSSPVTKVEVAIDNAEWIEVPFTPSVGYGASKWSIPLPVGAGPHRASVRATDAKGNSQPSIPRWNANGYGNNLIHSVKFEAG